MPPLMQSFMSQASARGARSTALHSLQWALGLLLAAIPTSLVTGAPQWLVVCLLVAVAIVLFVFLGSYVFLLFRNPDALRSEEFSLNKLAIEKGLIGDSTHGFIDPRIVNADTQSTALAIAADQGERKP